MDGRTRNVARVAGGVGRAVLALLSAAVLIATGFAYSLTGRVGQDVATSEAVAAPATPLAPQAAFTALLVGLDSRTDTWGRPLPPDVLAQLRAGVDEGQLHTDTIILLHVPAGPEPRAVAVSLPRDSFVEIAGNRGRHKINSAYRRGLQDAEEALARQTLTSTERERRVREAGRRTLVATVEDLTGVRVDHFAEVNLAGFLEITDALGGVPVCLNQPVREIRSGIDLPAGPQLVSGPDALAFVRQRHGLDDGDLDRIGRQQAFLAGLTSTVTTSDVMRDPVRLNRLAQAVSRYVVLDRGWNVQELVGQVRRVAAGELTFETIPTGTPALHTPVDGIAVEVDPDAVRAFVQSRMPAAGRIMPRVTTSRSRTLTAIPTAGPTPSAPGSVRVAAPGGPPAARPADSTTRGTTTSDTTTAPTTTTTTPAPITADGIPCVD